jgi:ABC-type uncharacterized transport system involved in gliding motility auxiliary subunit
MEGKPMKEWSKYSGFIGLALILISFLFVAIHSAWSLLNWMLIEIGGLLILVFIWIERKEVKQFFTTRSFKYSSHITLMSLIVFGIIILINVILIKHNFRWDTTKANLFSLSPQSKKIVRELKDDVQIKAFFRPGNQQRIRDLLEEYSNHSNRFKYEMIDPDISPGLVKQYNIEKYGTIVFEHRDKMEKINEGMEQEITNALITVTREEEKKIYFTTMHGEHDIDDINPEGLNEARKGIEAENYKVEKIFVAEQQRVPDDCSVLVIAGPQKDFLDAEYQAINEYLDKGDKLLVLLDPDQPNLQQLLEKWGFDIGNNTIIDVSPVGQLFGAGYGSPLIANYEFHEITQDFNLMTIFRLARSVTPVPEPDSGTTVKSLAFTTEFPGSWGETNLVAEDIEFDEGKDLKGPVSLAAVAEKDVVSKSDSTTDENFQKQLKTRIGVFGDSDFVTNAYYHFQGNGDLFLNVISWLAEQGDLISVRAKQPEDNRVSLTAQQSQIIFWLGVVLLPISILIAGIVIYVQRK